MTTGPEGGEGRPSGVSQLPSPGGGTPEVGGLTSREALKLLRGLRGLDYVGADLVEVSPPLDPTGGTALLGAAIVFELACLIAEPKG